MHWCRSRECSRRSAPGNSGTPWSRSSTAEMAKTCSTRWKLRSATRPSRRRSTSTPSTSPASQPTHPASAHTNFQGHRSLGVRKAFENFQSFAEPESDYIKYPDIMSRYFFTTNILYLYNSLCVPSKMKKIISPFFNSF